MSDPYRRLPSIADLKANRLASELQQKQQRLDPQSAVDQIIADRINRTNSGILPSPNTDLSQGLASAYNSAGIMSDLLARGTNRSFGTDFDDSHRTGLSNQAEADALAGFDGRENYQRDIQNLTNNFKNADSLGDYVGLLPEAAALGPRAALDSAGTLLEYALPGGILKAGRAVTGTAKAAKAKQAVQALDDVPQLSKLASTVKKAGVAAGETSVMTAVQIERMRSDYFDKHGTEPSGNWYAVQLPVASALMMFEGSIINKVIPKLPESFKVDIASAFSKLKAGDLPGIRKAISGYGAGIIKTGGSEAAQEYLQTWHEILATNISPEYADGFLDEVGNQLANKDNQAEAAVGGLLGAAAGSTTKGAVSLPGAAVNTATGAVKDVANLTSKGVSKAKDVSSSLAAKDDLSLLSDEERDTALAEHKTQKAAVDQKLAEFQTHMDTVDNATSFDDLKDVPGFQKAVERVEAYNELEPGQAVDPAYFEDVRKAVKRPFEKDYKTVSKTFEDTALNQLAKRYASEKDTPQPKTAPLAEVDSEALETAAKPFGGRTVTAVTEMKNTQTKALAYKVLTAKTGDYVSEVMDRARILPVTEIQRLAAAVEKKDRKTGLRLERLAQQKRNTQNKLGTFKSEVDGSTGVVGTVSSKLKKAFTSIKRKAANSDAMDYLASTFTAENLDQAIEKIGKAAEDAGIDLTADEIRAVGKAAVDAYNSRAAQATTKGAKKAAKATKKAAETVASKDSVNLSLKGTKAALSAAATATKTVNTAGENTVDTIVGSETIQNAVDAASDAITEVLSKENFDKAVQAVTDKAKELRKSSSKVLQDATEKLKDSTYKPSEKEETAVKTIEDLLQQTVQQPGITPEALSLTLDNVLSQLEKSSITETELGYVQNKSAGLLNKYVKQLKAPVQESQSEKKASTEKGTEPENNRQEKKADPETKEDALETFDTQEEFDNVATQELSASEAKALYQKHYPECKI